MPQRAGPLAIYTVLAPFASMALIVLLVPLAVLRRDALLAGAVGLATVVATLAYAPPPTPPPATAAPALSVLTWNLHRLPLEAAGLAAARSRWDPDVILLQEAEVEGPADLAVLDGMEVLRFPAAASPPGMVIATRLPILERGEVSEPAEAWDTTRAIWLRLATDAGPVTVVAVHLSVPFPLASLPCPYCPELRDAQVAALADFAAERIAAGERVVLAGDFNLSDREPAHDDLAGLADTARGATWRPLAAAWMPPLLRLDYVLIGPGLGVVSHDRACGLGDSDHCAVVVNLAPG